MAARIARLGAAEAAEARALLDALLPDDWRDGPPPESEALARALGCRRIILVGAWQGATPAGYASGHVLPSLVRRGDVAFLDDLLVAPAFRGRGIGRALVRRFGEAARAEGTHPVLLWAGTDADNAACRRAFEAAGGRRAVPEEVFVEYVWREGAP